MAETEQVAFRLSKALVERLDAYAERMVKEQPGLNVSRTDAVRVLLTRALDDDEKVPAKRPRAR